MAFTLDTYAHVLPGMQAEAAQDLADLVFGVSDEADQSEDDVELDDEDEDDDEPEPASDG